MIRHYTICLTTMTLCLWAGNSADGRGFGGGGFSGGGYRGGSFGGGGSFSDSRSFGGYSGARYGGFSGSYDHSYSGAYGGSFNTEGTRGAAYGPGGFAAGGSRDTSITGPEGRSYDGSSQWGAAGGRYGGFAAGGERSATATGFDGRSYSGYRQAGVASGPYGRTVGGAEGFGTATGARGTVAGGWQSAFAGTHFPTDFGLSHYTGYGAVGVARATPYWSSNVMATRAGYIRGGFGYYNCFRPGWYAAHPGCWTAAGWAAGAAWSVATWPSLIAWYGVGEEPINYDYGNTVVYQGNNVYVNGQDAGAATQYAQQAVNIADQGQQAQAPPDEQWKPLGVFALAQGDEKTSNNIFQLAINQSGTIRGNYYDGLMDTTTPVYGSVDQKSQRAAWTIGKKNDRVFEAGIYNLTKSEAPVLVHIGTDKTQQWLLVRVEQPSQSGQASQSGQPGQSN